MPKTILPRRWWLILACAVILSGCSSLKILPTGLALPGQDDKPQQPANIVAVWSDMVLQQPDGQAARGFGGRLTFYTAKAVKPVRVEGSLVVYGFEEEEGIPAKVQPDQKYVFTPEQFAQHYEKTGLGHSYAVWVPWDAAGGPHKEVSLIARFTPKNGQLVVGEQTRHVLPGSAAPESGQPKMARSGARRRTGDDFVRQASYNALGSSGPEIDYAGEAGGPAVQVTTIPVSPELAAQMRSAPPSRMDRPAVPARPYAIAEQPMGWNSQQAPADAAARRAGALMASPETERLGLRPADPRSTRFRPGQPRVLSGPIARPNRDRTESSPSLGESRCLREGSPPSETLPAVDPASIAEPTGPGSLFRGSGFGTRN